jgi:predicted amidophosphoribosyltransferase
MLLAHELCSLDSRFQLHPTLLTRVKETSRQVGLTDEERLENLKGAFVSSGNVERVLLIDDVMTTGATVNAAAMALIRAGCRHVEVFTLCRARRIFTA